MVVYLFIYFAYVSVSNGDSLTTSQRFCVVCVNHLFLDKTRLKQRSGVKGLKG